MKYNGKRRETWKEGEKRGKGVEREKGKEGMKRKGKWVISKGEQVKRK